MPTYKYLYKQPISFYSTFCVSLLHGFYYSFLVFSEQSAPYLLRLLGSGPVMILENAMNMSKNKVGGPDSESYSLNCIGFAPSSLLYGDCIEASK